MAITSGWSNISRGFRHRHYRNYQIGRTLFWLTSWMYRLAIGWMIWSTTGSATWLGVFGFLDQASSLLVLPLAGAVADRTNPLGLLRITQAMMLALNVLLSVLIALDMTNIWVLALMVLIYGVVNAAQLPPNQAIIPNLIPREDMIPAYAINSLGYNVTRFVGPMLAGIVINEWGAAVAIFCAAFGAAAFSVILHNLSADFSPEIKPREGPIRLIADIKEAFVYATRHKGVGPAMVILTALSFFPFSIDLLLPSLADGVYHAGPQGLAWMTSAMGMGAIVLAFIVARRPGIAGLTRFMMQGVLFLGFGYVALAFAPTLWVAVGVIFFIGLMSSRARMTSMVLLQYCVAPHVRGRVVSFYMVIGQAVPAFGALVVGFLCDEFGVAVTMGGVGILTLGVWFAGQTKLRQMAAALEAEAPRPVDPKPASRAAD